MHYFGHLPLLPHKIRLQPLTHHPRFLPCLPFTVKLVLLLGDIHLAHLDLVPGAIQLETQLPLAEGEPVLQVLDLKVAIPKLEVKVTQLGREVELVCLLKELSHYFRVLLFVASTASYDLLELSSGGSLAFPGSFSLGLEGLALPLLYGGFSFQAYQVLLQGDHLVLGSHQLRLKVRFLLQEFLKLRGLRGQL